MLHGLFQLLEALRNGESVRFPTSSLPERVAPKLAGLRPDIHLAAEDCLIAYVTDEGRMGEVLQACA
jgi:hypothetical protein